METENVPPKAYLEQWIENYKKCENDEDNSIEGSGIKVKDVRRSILEARSCNRTMVIIIESAQATDQVWQVLSQISREVQCFHVKQNCQRLLSVHHQTFSCQPMHQR